jgi:hypothetical protein
VNIPQNRVLPAAEKSADVVRVAPGKTQTIPLDRDAASVIVANPAHASVFLDNSRLLVVVPRAPGATNFTVLDNKGQTIMSRQIMVTDKDDVSYVRVTRICESGGYGRAACLPTTTYYCPDNCVPIAVPNADPDARLPQVPPIASAPSLQNSSGSVTTGDGSVN